jgi:nucleotide-binding universal stress UspA family protein
MFLKVLIGVDGSSCGRDAIALATRLVSPRGRLTLAHVSSTRPGGAQPQESRAAARRMLSRERMRADVDAELLSVSAASAGGGLHVLAEELDSELLVVGSCGRAGAGLAMLGDDTRAALNGAPCPVAIAAAGYARKAGPLQRVGVRARARPRSRWRARSRPPGAPV